MNGNKFVLMPLRRFGIFSITCVPASFTSILQRRKRHAGFVISPQCVVTIATGSTGRNESTDYRLWVDEYRTGSGPGSPRGQPAWGGGCDRVALGINNVSVIHRPSLQ